MEPFAHSRLAMCSVSSPHSPQKCWNNRGGLTRVREPKAQVEGVLKFSPFPRNSESLSFPSGPESPKRQALKTPALTGWLQRLVTWFFLLTRVHLENPHRALSFFLETVVVGFITNFQPVAEMAGIDFFVEISSSENREALPILSFEHVFERIFALYLRRLDAD